MSALPVKVLQLCFCGHQSSTHDHFDAVGRCYIRYYESSQCLCPGWRNARSSSKKLNRDWYAKMVANTLAGRRL